MYVEDVPEVISPLLMSATKRKRGEGVTVATGGTVQDAIFQLRSFLPGAESGHFNLQEVGALMKAHFSGYHSSKGDDGGDELHTTTTLKSQLGREAMALQRTDGGQETAGGGDVSWRYQSKEHSKHPERYTASAKFSSEDVDTLHHPTTSSRSRRYPTSVPASTARPKEYFLPTRGNLHDRKRQRNGSSGGEPYSVSEGEIIREFAKLDLSGDGKLTFLTVKSALELMQVSRHSDTICNSDMDDVVIRAWLRDHDCGSKGYMDMADFRRIFSEVLADVTNTIGGEGRGKEALSNSASFGSGRDSVQRRRAEEDRVNRLKA